MLLNSGARRRLLRIPWTNRKECPINQSLRKKNQSILKEINTEYSGLKRLLVKLKLQYFGHLMERTGSLEKTLMLGRLKAKGEVGGGE